MDADCVVNIVRKHNTKRGGLLSILQDIQLAAGYLSEESLKVVAEATGQSLTDIYGFASFYESFRFAPRARDIRDGAAKKSNEYIYVRCPNCNHSLMDAGCLVDGLPSVRITASSGMDHGWMRISSSSEIDTFACEYEFPRDGEADFFCPHCHAELLSAENCAVCGAPMVPQTTKNGFAARCSRMDCMSKSGKKIAGRCS